MDLLIVLAVLLALVASGLTRDTAYRIVQRNAMAAWEQGKPFRSLLEADPEVTVSEAPVRVPPTVESIVGVAWVAPPTCVVRWRSTVPDVRSEVVFFQTGMTAVRRTPRTRPDADGPSSD